MAVFEGDFGPPKGRFAIVASRFNALVVESLVQGAFDGFVRHGVSRDNVDLIRVPGALEIPLVAKKLAQSRQYRAVVCLGCVIRGETSHYDIVAGESAGGLIKTSLETGVPIVNGILTTETVEQAVNRAGVKAGNKGFDASLVAIEMVNLLAKLPGAGA